MEDRLRSIGIVIYFTTALAPSRYVRTNAFDRGYRGRWWPGYRPAARGAATAQCFLHGYFFIAPIPLYLCIHSGLSFKKTRS